MFEVYWEELWLMFWNSSILSVEICGVRVEWKLEYRLYCITLSSSSTNAHSSHGHQCETKWGHKCFIPSGSQISLNTVSHNLSCCWFDDSIQSPVKWLLIPQKPKKYPHAIKLERHLSQQAVFCPPDSSVNIPVELLPGMPNEIFFQRKAILVSTKVLNLKDSIGWELESFTGQKGKEIWSPICRWSNGVFFSFQLLLSSWFSFLPASSIYLSFSFFSPPDTQSPRITEERTGLQIQSH